MEEQIENIQPAEEQKKELTPEQKEIQEKFFRSMIIRKNRYHLSELFNYMKRRHLDLDGVREEISNKKCWLSKAQRDLVLGIDNELLDQLLTDMYGGHYRVVPEIPTTGGLAAQEFVPTVTANE